MPSRLHETLIEMVRERPAVVADLLAGPLGVNVPPFEKALLSSADLTDVTPTEFRADGVVTLHGTDGPVLAVVVEVQLRVDQRKRQTWPVYFATVHARHGCPVSLLVLCPSPAVANWCADPIRIGDPGMVLTPVVLGPRQVPLVTDVEQARRTPELAVISVLAHGDRDDPAPILRTLVAVLDEFDLDHAKLYTHLVVMLLPAAAQACLEEIMTTAAQDHTSELAGLIFPKAFARGKAEGRAEALLAILDTRGIDISDDVRARITTCGDVDLLDTWIRRAVTASTTDDLFA
jgi:hypothetical protein